MVCTSDTNCTLKNVETSFNGSNNHYSLDSVTNLVTDVKYEMEIDISF